MLSIRLKLFLMMFLEFFIWGAWLPLIFGYLPSLGFNWWQQALILNAFPASAILAMFFSNQFADRNFSAERFVAASHLIGGVAILALAFVTDFWSFFALMLIHCIFYVPTISITNSIAFASMKDAQEEFGIVRMGGTIGWIAAAWPPVFLLVNWANVPAFADVGLGGWLDAVLKNGLTGKPLQDATSWTYIVAGAASLLLAAFCFLLPHTPPKPAAEAGEDQAWLKAMKLLGLPFVMVLWIVTCMDSFVHNCFFNWTGRFLPTVGVPGNWVTPVMSIGQIAEIVTMAILGLFLKRLGWRVTMIIGILGHAARFAVFALHGTPDYMWLIVLVNVLHGICYAFFFATVYIFVDEHFPKDVRSSAQGLFNLMILGVGALLANFICPPMFDHFTGVTTVTAGSAEEKGKSAANEVQLLRLDRFSRAQKLTLSFRRPQTGKDQPENEKLTTSELSHTASAADVQMALEQLANIGPGNVKVSDANAPGNLHVEFVGELASQDVEPLSDFVDFHSLFLVPCGIAAVAALLLALFFWPPKKEASEVTTK